MNESTFTIGNVYGVYTPVPIIDILYIYKRPYGNEYRTLRTGSQDLKLGIFSPQVIHPKRILHSQFDTVMEPLRSTTYIDERTDFYIRDNFLTYGFSRPTAQEGNYYSIEFKFKDLRYPERFKFEEISTSYFDRKAVANNGIRSNMMRDGYLPVNSPVRTITHSLKVYHNFKDTDVHPIRSISVWFGKDGTPYIRERFGLTISTNEDKYTIHDTRPVRERNYPFISSTPPSTPSGGGCYKGDN